MKRQIFVPRDRENLVQRVRYAPGVLMGDTLYIKVTAVRAASSTT